MAARVCFVMCALLAVGLTQQDISFEDLNERTLGHVVALPVGTVNVPNNFGSVANAPAIPTGLLNPAGLVGAAGPGVIASGLTTLPTNTRPWNVFSNWFRPNNLAQQAALQDLTTPNKPGLCPYVRRLLPTGSSQSASICGNMCHNDLNCPHKTKCCPTECGYSCFDAVFVARN